MARQEGWRRRGFELIEATLHGSFPDTAIIGGGDAGSADVVIELLHAGGIDDAEPADDVVRLAVEIPAISPQQGGGAPQRTPV